MTIDAPTQDATTAQARAPRRARHGSPAAGDGNKLAHLRALDGLRGVAVLAVVLFHFSPEIAPGGFLGVDIFFVLSGFLITSLLVNELERSRRISLRQFWIRRARRLLPALFLVLAVVGFYALLVATKVAAHNMAEDGLAALGYVANWHFIASGQAYVEQFIQQAPSPLRHTWSLAIEEQFYLLWPLAVAGIGALVARTQSRKAQRTARARRRFRRALVVMCVVLGAFSLLEMIALFDARDPDRVYYGTDTRAFLLLIGAALGALTAGALGVARRAPRTLLIVAGCAASLALVTAMAIIDTTDTWIYQGGYGAIAVLIAVVLVAAAQPGSNPLARVFEGRPLVGLGLISYGVYLWHWPVVVWLNQDETGLDGVALFSLRAVITLTVSLASYWLVEQPIRRGQWPRWTTRRGLVPVLTAIILAVLLAIPVAAFPSIAAPPKVNPSRSSEETAVGYAAAPHCDGPLDTPPPVEAGVPPAADGKGKRPLVQLAGNSVAVELVPCLAAIVEDHGGAFESVAHSAAPPCTLLPALREQVNSPATRPDVAIWFAFDWFNDNSTCNRDWELQVREAIRIWRAADVEVYLAPIVPNVVPSPDPNVYKVVGNGVTVDAPAQTPQFQLWAAEDPDHITVLDPGIFIRDANGAYQWRMPCLSGGEPGCTADGTIGVRYVDGFHFCDDPAWDGTHCAITHAGGARRVAAAMASQIVELLASSNGKPAS